MLYFPREAIASLVAFCLFPRYYFNSVFYITEILNVRCVSFAHLINHVLYCIYTLDCKAIIQKHSKDFGGSLDDPDVIKLCGCSRNSYYKYKRELKKYNN